MTKYDGARVRIDDREKEWAVLMRAGNAGDAAAYRRLLVQLTPALRAFAGRGLAAPGFRRRTPRMSCRKRFLRFISSGKPGMSMGR